MYENDTIAAISTPLGEGGIGIVRLSGPGAVDMVEGIFYSPKGKKISEARSHSILHGYIGDKEKKADDIIDEVLVGVMLTPLTYTKEDVVEINCHGGILPLRKVLDLVLKQGARLAMPGEFTQRAFLNGRIDLVQAEAVIDVIRAKTDESRRIALDQLSGGVSAEITGVRDTLVEICAHVEAYIDFPEEEIEPAAEEEIIGTCETLHRRLDTILRTYEDGRFFREGISVAIVGRPNVGKSSLLNALLERDRAIVTDIPGTTRDVIEEYLNINGLPVRIIDTAGIRESRDVTEREGVRRSLKAMEGADLIVAVVDGSAGITREDEEIFDRMKGRKGIAVINKSDLSQVITDEDITAEYPVVKISAIKRKGLDDLKNVVLDQTLKGVGEQKEGLIITNIRHKTSLEQCKEAFERALKGLKCRRPLDIVAIDLRDALQRLGEIVGITTSEDILNKIFNDFCIGK